MNNNTKVTPGKDIPEVILQDGKITISVTIDELVHACEGKPDHRYRVTDKEEFGAEVFRKLTEEVNDESGCTPLHKLLDKVFDEIYDEGSECLEDDQFPMLGTKRKTMNGANATEAG